jgi:hypothetical protein
MCRDVGDFRPLNGSGTLNDQQLLWLYVMHSAEQIRETRSWCDSCRTDRALGIQKPHNCPSCGKTVNNANDPQREEKLQIYIEQQRRLLEKREKEQEAERARVEAELEANLNEEEEEGDHGQPDGEES